MPPKLVLIQLLCYIDWVILKRRKNFEAGRFYHTPLSLSRKPKTTKKNFDTLLKRKYNIALKGVDWPKQH